jgi:gluconolactonase
MPAARGWTFSISKPVPQVSIQTMLHRIFLAISIAFASLVFSPVAQTQFHPSQRYPDPLVRIIDPSFTKYRLPLAKVERIATDMRWSEGPVWFGDGRYLLWSDIPNNRLMKWEEETGAVSVFRKPARRLG